MTIPGVGFISALTLYAEICDIKRFSSPDKLAHYAGLVPKVRQSGEHTNMGRESKGDKMVEVGFDRSLRGRMCVFVLRVV